MFNRRSDSGRLKYRQVFTGREADRYRNHFGFLAVGVQGDSGGLRLGWVDLDLGSSPGWWASTVATYCPSRMVEHPKSKSTQPRYSTTIVTTLYISAVFTFVFMMKDESAHLIFFSRIRPRVSRHVT